MNDYYKVTNPYENVYRITSEENVYCELFCGKDKALLLDTGEGKGRLDETVRSLTSLPLIIVNSHGHPDHSGGNYLFPEEKYIHPADMALHQFYNGHRGDRVPGFPPFEDRLLPLAEGTVFDLGGITLEAVELPGHTPGSVGLIYKERKILYAADAINPWVWLFLNESVGLDTYIKTLRKAEKLDFELMYTGHGELPEKKESFGKFIDNAVNIDFENGTPDESIPDMYRNGDVRICPRKGYRQGDEGFCAIIICRSKLHG